MAERDVAVGRDAHQPEAGAARIRLGVALVNLLQRLAHVREAMMPVGQRGVAILLGEPPELRQQVVEPAVADRVVALRRRRHRRESDFPETHLVGEVTIDAGDVQRLPRQRHARADRPRPMARQQRLDLRRHDVVAAGAVLEDAEAILQLLRPVDRNGDADAVLGQELDDIRPQQRGVRGQAEVDLLADFGGPPPRVGNRRFQHREIQQRLAAEERHVRGRALARFAQQELDALARGLLRHELRLLAVLGVDDLVLAVLVAIGAAQVALVRDVHDQRLQRHRLQRHDLGARRDDRGVADRADAPQFADRVGHGGRIELPRQRRGERLLIRWRAVELIENRARTVVERKHRGARDEVEKLLPRRLEAMKFAPLDPAHVHSSRRIRRR